RSALAAQRLQLGRATGSVLLEPYQYLAGDRMPGQIGDSRGGQDEHRAVRKPASHVVERLPRRRIGVVDIVEDDEHRAVGAEVVQQLRQRSKQPFRIRLAMECRAWLARAAAKRPPS